jgi:virginiamycin B lyase
VTDGGQNAIARGTADHRVSALALPEPSQREPQHRVFDDRGTYWFTGQNGVVGRFTRAAERMEVREAPRAAGPTASRRPRAAPSGTCRSRATTSPQIADRTSQHPHRRTADAEPGRAPRSGRHQGRLVDQRWKLGNVSVHDPRDGSWRAWRLPGERPARLLRLGGPADKVWLTDFPANAVVRFDPADQSFLAFPSDRANANVRQMDGVGRRGLGRRERHRPDREDPVRA